MDGKNMNFYKFKKSTNKRLDFKSGVLHLSLHLAYSGWTNKILDLNCFLKNLY